MKFLIAAGGTGGHITPGLAIGTMLKNEGHEVIFIGTEKGLEKDLIPKAGFEIKYIHASGFVSDFQGKLEALDNLNKGVVDCLKIIDVEKPNMCIGTGGYVTAPLMLAALRKKVPTLIHESNALPGKTTKLVSRRINEVCVGFEETKNKLKRGNIVVTGNPNKMGLNNLTKEEAKAKIEISNKLLLIFGGSQGAKKINETILDAIEKKNFKDYDVIYATGPKNYDDVKNSLKEFVSDKYDVTEDEDSITLTSGDNSLTYTANVEGINKEVKTIQNSNKIIIKKFIYNMEEVMKASDLVVCRSGALTCSEIAEVGIASILIPFPYAAENHQFYNAKTLENVGAGEIIEEKNLTTELLVERINNIMDNDELLVSMAENSKKLRTGNPIENIKNEIYKILNL